MKIFRGQLILSAMMSLALFLCGCRHYQPYGHVATWLKRDNAVPQYFAAYDLFVVHPAGSEWEVHRSRMVRLFDLLKLRIANPFGNKVRVFAPLLHDDDVMAECELALEFYLDNFHDSGRPYAVIVEGRDKAFFDKFRDECSDLLERENGCALVYHTPADDFAADEAFVKSVARAVDEMIYERHWHRPAVPEDLSKALSIDTLADLVNAHVADNTPSSVASQTRLPSAQLIVPAKTPAEAPAPAAPALQEPVPPLALPPSSEEKPKESVQDPEPKDPLPKAADPIVTTPLPATRPTPTSARPPLTLEQLMNFGVPEAQIDNPEAAGLE